MLISFEVKTCTECPFHAVLEYGATEHSTPLYCNMRDFTMHRGDGHFGVSSLCPFDKEQENDLPNG